MMSSATNCYRLVYCPPYKILRHEVNYHHIITKHPMTKFLSLFALHPRWPCPNTKSYPNRPPSTPDVPTRHAPPQRWQVVKFHEAQLQGHIGQKPECRVLLWLNCVVNWKWHQCTHQLTASPNQCHFLLIPCCPTTVPCNQTNPRLLQRRWQFPFKRLRRLYS